MQGFASYRYKNVVDIPVGITGILGSITGVEGKSNGSGKSKLIMAILFALYGSGTYDRTEEIWNDKLGPKDEAYVRLEFSLFGNEYVVIRGRKDNGSYLDLTENGERLGDSNKESQVFINELLRMDKKLFTSSVFVSQGDLDAFIATEPKDRKKHVDTVLDIELWRKADADRLKTQNKLKETIDQYIEQIKSDEDQIIKNKESIYNLTLEIVDFHKYVGERATVQDKIYSLRSVEAVKKTITEYETLKGQTISDKMNLDESIKQYATEIKDSDLRILEADNLLKGYKDFSKKEVEDKIAKTQRDLEKARKDLTTLNSDRQSLITERALVDNDTQRKEQEKGLLIEGVCTNCKQTVTKDHVDRHKTEIEAELSNLSEKKKDIDVAEERVKKLIEEKSIQIGNLEIILTTATNLLSAYDVAYAKVQSVYTAEKELTDRMYANIETAKKSIEKYQRNIDEYTNKIAEERKKLPDTSTEDLSVLENKLTELDKTIESLNIKKGRIEVIEEEQNTLQKRVIETNDALLRANDTMFGLEVLAEAFREIPAVIFKDSIIEVEDYANEIIRAVLPGYRVRIYEDEEKKNRQLMIAFEVDGGYRNYKLLSGGQQTICALALRIGFNKVISQKAKVSINFLVLDEIFGQLDAVNRAEVLRALTQLTKYFPQILVITHTEEASLFPNIINVEMDARGVSYIR